MSSSSSRLYLATTSADHMELMISSQQESNIVQPTSLFPARSHNHNRGAPRKQSSQPPPTYPEAQTVVTVSATTLLNANRHICEICYQGFPRLQNLSFHQKTHNRPLRLTRRETENDVPRKVYLCPEPTCAHHNRSHALGDFAGLKKHYLRKHCTQRNYKCNKCSKAYAVASDLNAHLRICGIRKYKCDCGAQFSSHVRFSVHLEKCDALEHESAAKDPPVSNTGNNSDRSISNSSLTGSTSSLLPGFDMGDSSVRSISNENTQSLISSTRSTLPMFNKGDSLISSINNNKSSSLIGSATASPLLTSGMEPNLFRSTSNSYLPTTPNQSQLYHFATDQESHVTDPSISLKLGEIPPAFFPPSTTQKIHHGFQENLDMWFYTNLIMNNIPFDNVTLDDISFMAYGGKYGRSNSFTDGGVMFDSSSSLNSKTVVHNASRGQEFSALELFLNKNSVCSTYGNISSNIERLQDYTSPYSSSTFEFITPKEHNDPELAWNEHLTVSASRINSSSNMVQGAYASSPSSGAKGFIKSLEQNVLYGSDPIGIADNSGYNPLIFPVSGSSTVGFSLSKQDVGGNYQQEGYYGLQEMAVATLTMEVTAGAVAPSELKSRGINMGFG